MSQGAQMQHQHILSIKISVATLILVIIIVPDISVGGPVSGAHILVHFSLVNASSNKGRFVVFALETGR